MFYCMFYFTCDRSFSPAVCGPTTRSSDEADSICAGKLALATPNGRHRQQSCRIGLHYATIPGVGPPFRHFVPCRIFKLSPN